MTYNIVNKIDYLILQLQGFVSYAELRMRKIPFGLKDGAFLLQVSLTSEDMFYLKFKAFRAVKQPLQWAH